MAQPRLDPRVEIRPAEIGDLAELVAVYLSAAAHHAAIDPVVYAVPDPDAAAERWRRRVETTGPDAACVVSVVDGHVVGSASIEVMPTSGVGSMIRPLRTAEIGIGMLEGFRGLGIGRRLIAHLEGWAAEHGIERIILIVAESNEGAIRLYRQLGYVDAGRELRKELGES
jgi:ribosomal protein S18 acetylase RimI-like enzyme